MQKPYCKMTLKDLLDVLNSEKQEPAKQKPEIEIRSIGDFPATQIDTLLQRNAVLSLVKPGGSKN
jgi:hypothetical protein